MLVQTGGMAGSAIGRGPRDRSIGETVTIVQGPQKGYVGIIKDTNGSLARVELLTGGRAISVDKSKLRRRLYDHSSLYLFFLALTLNCNQTRRNVDSPG